MSSPESLPTLDQEDTRVSDSSRRTRAEILQLDVSERKEQKSSRRWWRWAIPAVTGAWLGLIVALIVLRRIEGVQVGIALGVPGAALLAMATIQVSWAYGRHRQTRDSTGSPRKPPRRLPALGDPE